MSPASCNTSSSLYLVLGSKQHVVRLYSMSTKHLCTPSMSVHLSLVGRVPLQYTPSFCRCLPCEDKGPIPPRVVVASTAGDIGFLQPYWASPIVKGQRRGFSCQITPVQSSPTIGGGGIVLDGDLLMLLSPGGDLGLYHSTCGIKVVM